MRTSRPGCRRAGADTARSRREAVGHLELEQVTRADARPRPRAGRDCAHYGCPGRLRHRPRGGNQLACRAAASRSPRPTLRRRSGPTSMPLRAGGLLFCSGQIPLDPADRRAGRCHRRRSGGPVPGEPRRGLPGGRHDPRRRGEGDDLPDRHVGVRGGQRGLRLVLRVEPAGPGRHRRLGAAARAPRSRWTRWWRFLAEPLSPQRRVAPRSMTSVALPPPAPG